MQNGVKCVLQLQLQFYSYSFVSSLRVNITGGLCNMAERVATIGDPFSHIVQAPSDVHPHGGLQNTVHITAHSSGMTAMSGPLAPVSDLEQTVAHRMFTEKPTG